jgi:site-specific recombinase XerD
VALIALRLQKFFAEHLARDKAASPNTVASYRDTWKMLLSFTADRNNVPACQIDFDMLDHACVTDFLAHLELQRGVSPKTRNLRLTAIRSMLSYASRYHPEHAHTISQVLAIPPKKHPRAQVVYLTAAEADALTDTPNQATRAGRRDRAMIALCAQTGLRLSELLGLRVGDVAWGSPTRVSCLGKGRKHRTTPVTAPVAKILAAWASERAGSPAEPLFPNRDGGTMSPDAAEHRLTAHLAAAAKTCPSLANKHVTWHCLRHSAAMRLLEAGADAALIALFLGHESTTTTMVYLHADLVLKQAAIDKTTPTGAEPGRYQPPDQLLAWLDTL